MKPLEFLAAVLPPPGHGLYCVAAFTKQSRKHVFVEDLSDSRPKIKQWLTDNRDIYFALATFSQSGSREASNALFLRSIFIDMDGYESNKQAATALSKFLSKTGLDAFGTPYIVGSGGGLHCYWPFDTPLDAASWKPLAENFKRLCKQEGLAIDMTVTADISRVLRIPGTVNFKAKYETPRPVKLMVPGNVSMDPKKFGATVRSLLSDAYAPLSNSFVPTSVTLEGVRPSKAAAKRSASAEALLNNSETRFEPIWIKSEKGVGCGQLEFYINNAQQDGMEPLWRGMLSWAKQCTDGDRFSQQLSQLHPYSFERMQQKLDEIKGPYPCVKLDSENPGICPKCPFWGNITNALALGREVVTDNRAKELVIPLQTTRDDDDQYEPHQSDTGIDGLEDIDDAQENVKTRKVLRPPPPRGFDYGKNGGVYRSVKEKDATGTEVKTQVQILTHDLFVVDMLRLEQDHQVHLMAIKPIKKGFEAAESEIEHRTIIMPSKSVVSRDDMLKCLATNNVYASFGQVSDKHLYDYVRACVENAAQERRVVDIPIQFGWQKDRSFVYNNRIFKKDGSEIPVPMPGLENINRSTNSKGTLDDWRKPWELLIQKQMHTMLALCMDAFGSTLIHFSDHKGFVWHIGSTASGTGKSLTLTLKAGVWGHPIHYRTGKGTSFVAMQQRAGLLNSLPLLIDEITSKTRNDVEWAPELIFDLSEGQGKERMESGTNRERVNNSTWALTCTMTSNTHMVDLLTGGRKHSSHGEMMRMLEWTPTKELTFSAQERTILRRVSSNYGVAGEAWVRWLVKNYSTAETVWHKVHERLRSVLNFADEERYWHAGCTSAVAAAILLGPKYANLLTVPVEALVKSFGELIESARIAHKKSVRTAEDILNTYTREFYGKFVVLRFDSAGQLVADLGKDLQGKTSTKNTVMGRIEHGTHDSKYVEYFIEESVMRRHCASMSFGYADFKRQLEGMQRDPHNFVVRYGRKDLLARTDGPAMRVNVIHISIPKESLNETGEISVE
jgi:hypothetical protein